MLTNNFKVRPDLQGDLLQQIAARIFAIDPGLDCPHDPREARAMLDELQRRKQGPQRGNELRLTQIHEVWNALLPQLAKARKLGIRSRDNANVPKIPQDAIITPDHLQVMIRFSGQLDEDIADFEAQTPDQRRIAKLEADLATAYAKLARAHNEHEGRIAALEATISGKGAA